jgi:hypothetical protein
LAGKGLPVCLKQVPAEPGLHPSVNEYKILLNQLKSMRNVKTSWQEMIPIAPLITGIENTDFWCRKTNDEWLIFFANPHAQGLTFPLEYGQSLNIKTDTFHIKIHLQGKEIPYSLTFKPYQSILIRVGNDGRIIPVDIGYIPKTPVYKPRIKAGKEKWEVGFQQK